MAMDGEKVQNRFKADAQPFRPSSQNHGNASADGKPNESGILMILDYAENSQNRIK